MEQLSIAHGLALSNLPVFVAHEYGFYKDAGVAVELLRPKKAADVVNFLRSGRAQMASCAFTSLMSLYDEERSHQIVAGAGVRGLAVLGKSNTPGWQELPGSRAATLRGDVLEVLLYELLQAHGLSYESLQIQYCSGPHNLTKKFVEREVDIVTQLEPYSSQLMQHHEAELLSDGTDLWGSKYPDCVIAAHVELIEQKPDVVKAVLQALLYAQAAIEQDLEQACRTVAGTYYQASLRELLEAVPSMPPGVDIRDQADVILGRGETMAALGYIERPLNADFTDFSLLQEVVNSERELWANLKIRPKE